MRAVFVACLTAVRDIVRRHNVARIVDVLMPSAHITGRPVQGEAR
jgi:hypothetical protein